MGGSFNPAHEGHLHISRLAIARLGLDQLWWLVSPQNPLKPAAGMAPLAERMAGARAMARHRRIRVTDIEVRLGTRYTADTLDRLRRRYRRVRFVWVMGADNLRQISDWRRWTAIFRTIPIAVFDRATYSFPALASKAAQRFRRYRLDTAAAGRLARCRPPAWIYFLGPRHPASATLIREAKRARRKAKKTAKRK